MNLSDPGSRFHRRLALGRSGPRRWLDVGRSGLTAGMNASKAEKDRRAEVEGKSALSPERSSPRRNSKNACRPQKQGDLRSDKFWGSKVEEIVRPPKASKEVLNRRSESTR